MELWQKQAIFSKHVGLLINYIFNSGYFCTFGDAFRSPEQAQINVTSGKGIKNSLHCKRLAIDLNLISPNGEYLKDTNQYEHFGIYWESLDPFNKWGGKFNRADGNHFQRDEN